MVFKTTNCFLDFSLRFKFSEMLQKSLIFLYVIESTLVQIFSGDYANDLCQLLQRVVNTHLTNDQRVLAILERYVLFSKQYQ
jgi:hypothetical protein